MLATDKRKRARTIRSTSKRAATVAPGFVMSLLGAERATPPRRRTPRARVRGEAITRVLPPRLRNWTAGSVQVGVFIRDEAGRVVEASSDKATPEAAAAAYALLKAIATGPSED